MHNFWGKKRVFSVKLISLSREKSFIQKIIFTKKFKFLKVILSHIYRYTLTLWLRQFDRVSIILSSIFQSKFPLVFLIKSINQSFLFVVVMSAKKVTFMKKGCVILVWVKQVVTSRVRRTFVVFRQLEFSVNYATACNTAIWKFFPYFCDKYNIFTQSCRPRLMNTTVPTKIL